MEAVDRLKKFQQMFEVRFGDFCVYAVAVAAHPVFKLCRTRRGGGRGYAFTLA
jgi:hypothetical protein